MTGNETGRILLISIITVNLNNAEGLRRTLESVAGQKNRDFQYIVIDGGSIDKSVEVIEEYSDRIDYWVSEPDRGMYEAMNKGIRKAKGEYCLFLNSGDWLNGDLAIEEAASRIDGSADIYFSDLIVSDCLDSWMIRYPEQIDTSFFITTTLSHQNSLIRKKTLFDAGLYREDFVIVSDWYFFLYAAYRLGATFRYLKNPIALYFHKGMSNDRRYDRMKEAEHSRGIDEVFGPLGESIRIVRKYKASRYYEIIDGGGDSRALDFLLKAYWYFARRLAVMSGRRIRKNRRVSPFMRDKASDTT